MFHELADDPGGMTTEELYELYVDELAAVVEAVGAETVAAGTDLDPGTVETLGDGGAPELTLEEAAAVLAARDGRDPGAVAAASRDALLLGMTNAVLDVEALASGIDGEMEPREIQAKVEGRIPMTLREFALLYAFVRGHAP